MAKQHMGIDREETMTGTEVINFWEAFCEKQNIADFIFHEGVKIIGDNVDYWANKSMWDLYTATKRKLDKDPIAGLRRFGL